MRVLWAPGALTLGKTHRPITLLTTPFSDLAPLTGHPFFQTARKQPHSTPDCQEAASPEQYTREPHKASGYQLLRQNCNLPGGPKKLCLHRPLGIPQTHRNPKTKRGGGLSSNRRRNCARLWQERLCFGTGMISVGMGLLSCLPPTRQTFPPHCTSQTMLDSNLIKD